jgi:hypothetical protein
MRAMSTNTLRFAVAEAMRSYVDQRLRELIEGGLNSGTGRALTPERAARLKKRVLGDQR